MTAGLVIGFDYGQSRVGIAIGNRITGSSRALKTLSCPTNDAQWQALIDLVQSYQPAAAVVGIPVHMDGSSQPLTRKARAFCHGLRERLQLRVHEVDERLSSDAAEAEIRQARASGNKHKRTRRGEVDAVAAALLVEQWMSEN